VKFIEVIVLLMLLGALGFGVYVLWLNLPFENATYKPFSSNFSTNVGIQNEGAQFYPNMRFPDKIISYRLESTCPQQRWVDVERAFAIISEKTVLKFYNSRDNPEIKILCSRIAPMPGQEGHFIAGEGGPTEIINTTNFAVILGGNISLYREEQCDEPKIAIHEILHALGFDHHNISSSIMNPVTGCNQEIDQYIIDDINSLYKMDSLPDLGIDSIKANRTGRYLNFEINVSNQGLKESKGANLDIYTLDRKIGNFSVGDLDIGTRKMLFVQNEKLAGDSSKIIFLLSSEDERELSLDNNRAEISL
jgi:hypothetical protein